MANQAVGHDVLVGQTLRHYRIVEKIGAGGMGEVFRAHDEHLDRDVAIKVLPPGTLGDESARKRFHKEALTLSKLNHPNIATIHDFDTQRGVDFLVMEYIPGTTLDEKLGGRALPEKEVISLGAQLAEGLSAAHEHGVIHRDLKPGNLRLSTEGRLKVLDFGLARLRLPATPTAPTESLSETHTMAGTLPYMAPEQLLGGDIDARTDIHAAGEVLYEMATGQQPFAQVERSQLIGTILHKPPRPPSALNPKLSPELERIIGKCLEKEPENRYQSAKELAIDLRRMLAPSTGQVSPVPVASKKFWKVLIPAALILTIALVRMIRRPAQLALPEVVPLVTMEGKQSTPVFSPDGNQVAFVQDAGPHPGIYTTMVAGGRPLQLTNNPNDSSPTWSPDGREIAFARLSEPSHQESFYVVPALGGSERRVYTGPAWTWDQCGRIEWSPDGKSILFQRPTEDRSTSRITLLSLSDLTTRTLTSPAKWIYDCEPTYSPDGSSIAFVRGTMGAFRGDLFVLKTGGGDPVRLTSGNSGGEPAWTPDGKEIVFSSPMGGLRNLYRISITGGTPQPVAGAVGIADSPSIARKGNQLVYQQMNQKDTIWRLDLKDERHALGPPMRILSARGFVWKPSVSPDDRKVAFESDRLGFSELWVCDIDGSHCAELTSMHGWSDTARWSPDGRFIAFEAILQDYYQIYVVEVEGGSPRHVTTFPESTSGLPNWSRNGQWIYFYSLREDQQLWKVPFKGGPPVQVTKNGGVYGTESYDGHFLYYSRHGPGVWKMPVEGGEETRVLDKPSYWNDWALAHNGIYYLNTDFQPNGRIEFFDFATRSVTPIFSPEKPVSFFGGVTLSPDGSFLLFGQKELDESYIVSVKNFH